MKVFIRQKGLKDQLETEGCSFGGVKAAKALYYYYIQIAVSKLNQPLSFREDSEPKNLSTAHFNLKKI